MFSPNLALRAPRGFLFDVFYSMEFLGHAKSATLVRLGGAVLRTEKIIGADKRGLVGATKESPPFVGRVFHFRRLAPCQAARRDSAEAIRAICLAGGCRGLARWQIAPVRLRVAVAHLFIRLIDRLPRRSAWRAVMSEETSGRSEPQVIGSTTDYDGLIKLFRARVHALGCTCASLDAAAGTPERYIQKLLNLPPMRGIGRLSLGLLLSVLGLRLDVVVDESGAFEQIRHRLVPARSANMVMRTEGRPRRQRRFFDDPRAASLARKRGLLLMGPARRRVLARIAANARWARRHTATGDRPQA
jgi:hypothetical protein